MTVYPGQTDQVAEQIALVTDIPLDQSKNCDGGCNDYWVAKAK